MGEDIVDLTGTPGDNKTHFVFTNTIGNPSSFGWLNFLKRGAIQIFFGGQDKSMTFFDAPRESVQNVLQPFKFDTLWVIHASVDFGAEGSQCILQCPAGLSPQGITSPQKKSISDNLECSNCQSRLVSSGCFLQGRIPLTRQKKVSGFSVQVSVLLFFFPDT
jgi:hypothetical protein